MNAKMLMIEGLSYNISKLISDRIYNLESQNKKLRDALKGGVDIALEITSLGFKYDPRLKAIQQALKETE